MNYTKIIDENTIRRAKIKMETKYYNPYTGEGSTSIDREKVYIKDAPFSTMWLPKKMLEDPAISDIISAGSIETFIVKNLKQGYTEYLHNCVWKDFVTTRFKYDFEYWAAETCMIEPKEGGADTPFILNRAQRKLLKVLMAMFLAGVPIKVILLKARQWGGSTLVQLFMAWIQLIHKTNWNSVIAAHQQSTARVIKGMYSKVLKSYPFKHFGNTPYSFTPYQGSQNTYEIKQADCRVTIGSAEKPDSIRGEHTQMAHLTEIAFWKKTEGKRPEDIVQAICSGILDVAYSMIVYESTAKGVGNFFNKEWLRAINKKSDFYPIFISWVDYELYSKPVENYKAFIDSLNEYEWSLWNRAGTTLEQIHWYRITLRKLEDIWRMKSEFPSWAEEAFQSTGQMVFNADDILRLSKSCKEPIFTGDVQAAAINGKDAIKDVKFYRDDRGFLKVWALPDDVRMSRRYVVSVDIGGRSRKSDFSVIRVYDRYWMHEPGGVPELVAQWRGHIDHDLLAWKAAQIAQMYNNAKLVFESNVYETEETEGSHGEYILHEISNVYTNLYTRVSAQQIREGAPVIWGFHTNKQTKTLLTDTLVRLLREDGYIERDQEACTEYQVFEVKENGKFGAVDGNHDDIVMSSAIGLFVCYDFEHFALPHLIEEKKEIITKQKVRTASDF